MFELIAIKKITSFKLSNAQAPVVPKVAQTCNDKLRYHRVYKWYSAKVFSDVIIIWFEVLKTIER